jgi:DeoR family transcriptional regulator, fructose operon transcriptional repressor
MADLSKPLIPAQRRERIQEYLLRHKIATNSSLSILLEVSEATIRRDLELLEEEGFLERTHGGAVLRLSTPVEPEYLLRAQRFPEQKQLIGAAAAAMVEDGDIIFINSGTTTTQIIRNIRRDADVIVITNNLSAALEVGVVGYQLVLLGGNFQNKSNSVAGRFTFDNINTVYATKSFIGVDGINLKYGWTVPSNSEAEVIRMMMARTLGPVIAVSDHSKWGNVANFEIARIEQIHRLITDEGMSEQACTALAGRSVEVIRAGNPEASLPGAMLAANKN